jgi:hypothetical protein
MCWDALLNTSEHLFEILLEGDQVQQRSAWLHSDKQIYVALWSSVANCR